MRQSQRIMQKKKKEICVKMFAARLPRHFPTRIILKSSKFRLQSAILPPFCTSTSATQSIYKDETKIAEKLSHLEKKYSIKMESFRRRKRWLKTEVKTEDQEMYSMGAVLYYQASTGFDLGIFVSEFHLADSFTTWFRLCVLHMWLALLRCAALLEHDAFCAVRDALMAHLWEDCEGKMAVLSAEVGTRFKSRKNLETLHAVMLQMFIELDEGVVTDDQTLAGSVWRTFYDCSNRADPVALAKMVKYIRMQAHLLDQIPLGQLQANGVSHWRKRS